MSQRLNSYFRASPELRQMSTKVAQLLAVQRQYEQLVPASLKRYSSVMQLEQRVLTLAANNSAIAAKLRQLAPDLAKQLRDKGCEVTGIQVRVQVVLPDLKRVSVPSTLSPAGCEKLVQLSEALSDSPLKSALQRLVKKATKRGKG